MLPCAVYLSGQYGYKDLYIGVPAKLGKGGLLEVLEIKLLPEEKTALDKSADSVRGLVKTLAELGY